MEKTTFWDLITSPDIKKICIPTIQRDYALGRYDKVFNRQNFLEALKKAVCKDESLSLDFVYGVDNETMFIPLDGQQRLTTLWLLHWYISYKAGILFDSEIIKGTLKKFSYETRSSSTEFCKSLCELSPNTSEKSLREWITQQTWFFLQYKQDPTIMGMLNMISGTNIKDENDVDIIDGFEEIFCDKECDYHGMWERLTTTKCIQFNKLHVSLSDSDELYVKMNARGKQLTDFENFKAELVKFAKEDQNLGEAEALKFAAKLDVEWTDIFWKNRWEDTTSGDVSIDEIYFTFINRFVRLKCIQKYNDESDFLKKNTNTFTSFEPYKDIMDKKSIKDFILIMDRLRDTLRDNKLETTSLWGESFDFVPKYLNENKAEVSKITNTQHLIFYGYCQYFVFGGYDIDSFTEWNRVLWNICENRVDKSNLKPTMVEIDLLAPHSHDILDFLSQEEDIECKQNKEQLLEEQRKARHLKDYPIIKDMEGYIFFKGAIRFLYTGQDKNEDWSSFEKKVQNVKVLIPEKREERHTIKLLTPYISKRALCQIYYDKWVSNNDEELRALLLDDKVIPPFLHNFLLQNDVKADISLLHQDIMDICEEAFNGTGYLQTCWNDSEYIWTNYERATRYHGWYSYVVGNEAYSKISKMLDDSKIFNIYEAQRNRRIGSHIQASYLHFTYQAYNLTLYGNNTICLMTDNWEQKITNPDDPNGYYFSVHDIETEDLLISQVKMIIEKYNNGNMENHC